MLTEKDLKGLLNYRAKHPVLSLYLNTDPSKRNSEAFKLTLRAMFKDVDLPADIAAIERYLQYEFDWSGRSVAVFSCAPEKFLQAFPLAIPIRSRARVGDHPHVKPLADLLDSYGGYGVALVDKQGARMFYFHLGELREQEGVLGENVRRTKRGGASSVAGRRGGIAGQTKASDEIVDRNMREAAEFATHFFSENNVRRVLIGGTDDNVAQFRSQLPKAWQSLVVGTFPMGMTASKDEVMSRAMQIGHAAERRREAQLVELVVTNAAKGHGGAIRLDDTLGAVHEGRVQTLVIREGFRAPGYHCQGCGYITAQKISLCPFCGATFQQIPDAVEMAVHKVMQQGGEVEVLPAGEITETFENIGAILRY
jgi:peptide chain release factor subunit 1